MKKYDKPLLLLGPKVRDWMRPGDYAKAKKLGANRTLVYKYIKLGMIDSKRDHLGRIVVKDK